MLPRKHRYTLFLGYGTEAEGLLKAFEQSKCRLGFNTNILFIKFLLEFHGSNSHQPQQHTGWSHRSNEKEEIDALKLNTIIQNIDVVEDDSSSCQQLNHINFKSDKENAQENIIKGNKEVLVDTTITNPQILPLSETVEKEQQEETLIDTPIDQDVIVDVVQEKCQDDDLETKNSSSFSDKDKDYEISDGKTILTLSSNLSSTGVLQTEEGIKKINENIVFSSPKKLNDIENTTTTTKEGENFFSEASKVNDKQNLILKKNTAVIQQPKEFLKEFEVIDFKTMPRDFDECRLEQQKRILSLQDVEGCEPVDLNSTKDMLHDFKPVPSNAKYVKHVHDTLISDPKSSKNAFTTASTTTNIGCTPLEVIEKYMDHVTKTVDYYCNGFISSSEKLRQFLDEYRQATNMLFTIRTSRSYIKMRASSNNCSSVKRTSDFHVKTTLIGKTDENKPRSSATGQPTNLEDVEMDKNHSTVDNLQQHQNKNEKITLMDSIMTGPLRWEYDLGKPPIPFVGIPFCIIGNTHYQCFYTSPDSRTLRKNKKEDGGENVEDDVTDFTLPRSRKRSRRSLKRDCKAVMCIKSVVSFPEFDIRDSMLAIKSKKGCRKLKEAALSRVRSSLSGGQSVGHPAFWLNIPLPEAHTTHELVPPLLSPQSHTSKADIRLSNTADEQPSSGCVGSSGNDGGLDAISQIVNVAAQYGGKVQILQKSNGDLLEFQLEDGSGVEGEKRDTEESRTGEAQGGNTTKIKEENKEEEELQINEKDLSFKESPS